MLSSLSDKNIKYIFLFYTFIYMLLHYQAHMYITGGVLPPHSDSLVYQHCALSALDSMTDKTFSMYSFLYGTDVNAIPPVYKIVLLLSYMIGGLTSGSEYVINYIIVLIGGLYLGKISFLLYKNISVQYLTFLAYITLHGIVVFSLYDTRNDTLTITLYIVSIYYLLKSDFFYDLKYSLLVSILISLALLTKSAFGGYIIFPFFFLLFIIYKTKNKKLRYRNVLISLALILLLIGWYYIVKYDAIIDYYSYWSNELKSIVYDQYDLKTFKDRLMFYPISTLNHFGYLSYIVAPFLVYSIFLIVFEKINLRFDIDKKKVFLVSLVVLPYIVLYGNGSYSIVADLYMVPFILVIVMAIFNRYKNKKLIYVFLFFSIGFLGIYNVIQHYSMPRYNNIDYKSFSYKLDEIIKEHSSMEKSVNALFYDLDLSMETIEYINIKDVFLRNNANLEIADINYKTRVTPSLSAKDMYTRIKEKSEIILITNKSKGPLWININQKWEELYTLIKNDEGMIKIGEIDTYIDKTKVEVYLKNNIDYTLTTDSWLLNKSILKIIANPNKYVIKIENRSKVSDIETLFLEDEDGNIHKCTKEITDDSSQYICALNIKTTKSRFIVHSIDPLIPSSISDSKDERSLLLYKPIIQIKNMQQARDTKNK